MIHLQVIATSVEDCIVAQAEGADSIELCAALELGGITPSLGLLRAARAACALPIHAMLRPRPGGAVYSDNELAVMLEDAAAFSAAGCAGLVCGFMTDTGLLDQQRCRALRSAFPRLALTFHRAFDLLPNPAQAVETLKQCEFDAILTSGQAATALAGAPALRDLVAWAQGEITVIAGSGVTPGNICAVASETGCTAVHGSFSGYLQDASLAALPGYRFGTQDERIRFLDGDQVRAARVALNGMDRQA